MVLPEQPTVRTVNTRAHLLRLGEISPSVATDDDRRPEPRVVRPWSMESVKPALLPASLHREEQEGIVENPTTGPLHPRRLRRLPERVLECHLAFDSQFAEPLSTLS